MAEHVLETRIQLRYGTYSEWMNSDVILKQGEAAICSFPTSRTIYPTNNGPENTPPAIGMKIGDGQHYFHELPWVQAVAADVYNWAKQTTKPTYTANEISGLAAYIEEHAPGGGSSGNIAARLYQITSGENEDANKYYLRYKENTDDDWTVDTNHYIDLSDLVKVLNWIYKDNLTNFPSLANFTRAQVSLLLGNLNATDPVRENYFVTAVNESGGIISTVKAQPQFSNIAGTATVSQGGTGATSLAENSVLVGNGTNQILTRPIATEIASNTDLVPNYLVKAYIDTAVEGLTGAMHFIGEATVVINPNSNVDPRINGYNFSQAQPGDVILYNAQEFVWTGGIWRLLGDEGSYAVKGSITNADISPDAAITVDKISGLTALFNTKVDKVEGKILSSNDYTDEDKLKLLNIENHAQQNVIEHIFLNDTEIVPTIIDSKPKSIDLHIQEFDQASQTKLQSIEVGAQVNAIEHIFYDGQEITPDDDKTITITSNPHNEYENKIETISINGTTYYPDQNKQVKITIDQAALNLNVLEGATIPNLQGGRVDVAQSQKKLELERIAVSGDVKDLRQTADTYIVLDCGSSTTVL